MRRVGLAVLLAGMSVAGCGSFRDVFTSHAETVARVGSRELKSARVAEMITRLGGPTANPAAADLIAGIWVDFSLFADRVAEGTLNSDSAAMRRLMWPQITEARIQAWHDTIIARRTGVSPNAVDSIYAAGNVRLFQHILFMASGSTAADTAKAKAEADRIAPQARTGDFGKLAAQYSADGSKSDSGFLPPGPKGIFVPEFDNAAWVLAPGGVSPVIKSQFGYHIIRRPQLSEVRDRLGAYLKQQSLAQADSAYMTELQTKSNLVVKGGTAAAIRTAAADPGGVRKSNKTLVEYKGGSFTVADLVPWLEALPLQTFAQIKMANDTILDGFAKQLAMNKILLAQADSAKVAVNPALVDQLSGQFKTAMGGLREVIGLEGPEFSDSSKIPVAERRKQAAAKVDAYFEKLGKGEAQYRPVPPTLSAELRRGGDYKIFQAGIARAKELIVAQKAKDSAAAGNAPPAGAPQPGGLQPAPGGPPGQAQPDSARKP